MKILTTGVNGQLGYDVIRELSVREIQCKGVDIGDFDITDFEQCKKNIIEYKPTAIIHCAAYTAVDKAEDEPEKCYKINVDGTKNISLICKELNIPLMYISTDYVFDGEGSIAYEVDNRTSPIGVYGKSKLDGEVAVISNLSKYFVVRMSWGFGKNGNNFIKIMLKLGKECDSLSVVSDQIGSPTYTADLSKLLCDMIVTDKYGIYHATNEGYCSWAEFASEIFKLSELKTKVNYITTEQYPTKAKRPKNSRMSKKSIDDAGFERLPDWKDALSRYLKEIEI